MLTFIPIFVIIPNCRVPSFLELLYIIGVKMKHNACDIHYFLRRGKKIVFLFCQNLLFSIIGFVFLKINRGFFQSITIAFFLLSTLTIISAIPLMIANLSILKKSSDYFFNNCYFKDMNRIKLFHKLLDENLFEYHFQPIISARTGEIFAYEALMRSGSKFNMAPHEILDLAAYENRLYDIEHFTYNNTLKIFKENHDFIKDKKLFINSISSHPLKDSDFNLLIKDYGSQFSSVVIEITEGTLLSDPGIDSIKKRLIETNCQLALDDYGSGFSNEASLLKTNPNYLKIDRAILKSINSDSKKQHLVSNIVNFSSQNNIQTIAEGIETFEELLTVIHLGIDYIQGFYTAKPAPYFLNNLSQEHIDAIKDINRKRFLEAIIN